eukprot:g13598.t1
MYTATNGLETEYPEALFIVDGDFNQANPECATKMPSTCIRPNQRAEYILNHCYTTVMVTTTPYSVRTLENQITTLCSSSAGLLGIG